VKRRFFNDLLHFAERLDRCCHARTVDSNAKAGKTRQALAGANPSRTDGSGNDCRRVALKQYAPRVSSAAAVVAIAWAPVIAAQAPGTPSPQAAKAAADATRAAQKITFETRNGSGVSGDVGLFIIGRSRTRIVVRLPNSGRYRLTLYPGSDCIDNRAATQADVALTPTNFNTTRASMSSTIVALPIEKVRSNYVIDVRDAGNRSAVAAACARLNR